METLLLALTLVSSVVIGVFGLILQHQQNVHFKQQNEIMVNQAGGAPMPEKKPPRWPLGAMAAMMLMTWTVAGFDYLDRHYPVTYKVQESQWYAEGNSLPVISDADLTNQTVNLDGRRYDNCVLGNTILEYEGEKPAILAHCSIKPGQSYYIRTDNPVIQTVFALSDTLQEMSSGKSPVCIAPDSQLISPLK